jgi:hypothetical protein
MIKEKSRLSNFDLTALILFVLFESVLYFLMHATDFGHFSEIAYLSIILATVFSFLSVRDSKREDHLVRLGMLFTLGADFCLVALTPARQLLGVIIFIFTQTSYFLYILAREQRRTRNLHVLVRTAVSVVAILIALIVLGERTDWLSIVSVLYYSWLVLNLLFSLADKELRLFSIGLFLFALCDLSIGLVEIADTYFGAEKGSLLYKIVNVDLNLAWIFYLPSQTIIPISLLFKRERDRRKDA